MVLKNTTSLEKINAFTDVEKNYHYLIDHGNKVFPEKNFTHTDISETLLNLDDASFFDEIKDIKEKIRKVTEHLDEESKFQFFDTEKINSLDKLVIHFENLYGIDKTKRDNLVNEIYKALTSAKKIDTIKFEKNYVKSKYFGMGHYEWKALIDTGLGEYWIKDQQGVSLEKKNQEGKFKSINLNTPVLENILDYLKEVNKVQKQD